MLLVAGVAFAWWMDANSKLRQNLDLSREQRWFKLLIRPVLHAAGRG